MKIEALNAPVQILESNSIKQLPRDGIGDVLKAQVVGKSDAEVILRLDNGNVISASTEIPLDVKVGDTIQLEVKGKQDGKIMLETLKNDSSEIIKNSNTEQIQNLLNSLGITPNSKNVDVINEMMIRQMPLTKENVQSVLKGITKFAELDIPKAVFMLANNIPFEEKNIEILTQYQEGKIKLGNQIKSIGEMIDQIEDPKLLNEVLQKLNKIDEGKTNKAVDSLVEKVIKYAGNVIQEGKTIKHEGKALENNYKNENVQTTIPLRGSIDKNIQKIQNKEVDFPVIKQDQVATLKKVITDKIDNLISILKTNTEENVEVKINDLNKAVINITDDELKEVIKQMPKNEKETIVKLLGDIATKDKLPLFGQKSDVKSDEVISLVDAESNDIVSLKEEIKSHFQKHFISTSSDSLKDDLNVTENYKELMGKLESLKENLVSRAGTNEMQTLIGRTEENINFMRDISQYNAFVQIPLNVFGQETNGQLFVLKKDKRKIDPANASLFLSLDMPSIGLTEVFVKVQSKNVDCNFRMENEDLVSFLKENAQKLVQLLNSQGYKFISVNCSLIEKKTGIVEVDKNFENDKDKKFSIDVKV